MSEKEGEQNKVKKTCECTPKKRQHIISWLYFQHPLQKKYGEMKTKEQLIKWIKEGMNIKDYTCLTNNDNINTVPAWLKISYLVEGC